MAANDPQEARLREAVKAARRGYARACAALTPAASEMLAGRPARGPLGAPVLTAAGREAQRIADAYRAANTALQAANVALHAYLDARIEEERRVGLSQLDERTRLKDAQLAARGVPAPNADVVTPLPTGGRAG